jgi:hypothetical protein
VPNLAAHWSTRDIIMLGKLFNVGLTTAQSSLKSYNSLGIVRSVEPARAKTAFFR